MSRIVVNVSTSKYYKGQNRLIETLTNVNQEMLMFRSEDEVGARPHFESMYAFKPYSFVKVLEWGYSTVLWLDASMYVLKDLSPIFEQIERDGFYAQDSGWTNDRWTTPEQKEYFGTNKGTMISSGVIGIDWNNPVGLEFMKRWNVASDAGMFNGSHEVTRHDQTAASLIIEQMGLLITPNNTHWSYGRPEEEPLHENILILANGII